MPQLSNTAKTRLLANGQLLKYLTGIRITGESGKSVVHTMDGDRTFAGFAQGESVKQIEMSYTIPVAGPEFDFEKFNSSSEFLTLQVFIAGTSYGGLGQITSNNIDDSTSSAISGTAVWVGEAKPFK